MLPILVVISSAHEVLYRDYFRPTLPPGFEIRERDLGRNRGDGAYLSGEWQDAMVAKVTHALEFCQGAPEGAVFIVSDVDVQFFPPLTEESFRETFAALDCDLAFQRERLRPGDTEVNCGFYAGRNTAATRAVLAGALDYLNAQKEVRNEQSAVNAMLQKNLAKWTFLDARFYGRTHGFPPNRDIVMHHASWTFDVPEKIVQLERVRRILRGSPLRVALESFAEFSSRMREKLPGLSGKIEILKQFFSRLPIKPLSFP